LPHTRLEAKIGAGERAHRTDIGGIAAKLTVEKRVALRDNLPPAPTIIKTQHRVAGQLVLKAHTAGAQDAALAVQVDQVAERDRLLEMNLIGVVEAAQARPPAHRQVLQRALAALIAHRAIERMRGQQELNLATLCKPDALADRIDGH